MKHSSMGLAVALILTGCGGGEPASLGDGQEGTADTPAGVKTTDLGQVTLAPRPDISEFTSESDTISFDVPKGALSVTLYAQGAAPNVQISISHLVGPEGVLIDVDAQQALVWSAHRFGSVSFTLPQAERELVPGRYGVKLRADTPPPLPIPGETDQPTAQSNDWARVFVVTRAGDAPTGGRLDINLFFVPGVGLASDDTTTVGPLIDRTFGILSRAGITVGEARRYDLSTDTASFLNPNSDYLQARLREHSQGAPAGLDVFVVHAFDDGQDGVYQGRTIGSTGGIPGASSVQGMFGSGILLALGPVDKDGQIDTYGLGVALAHEVGHALGLAHTTEKSGALHDHLDDTPECPPSADHDGDGQLLGTECLDYDGANLMFWNLRQFITKVVEPTISPEQMYVMLRSPLVR
jgi:hypothetical protein